MVRIGLWHVLLIIIVCVGAALYAAPNLLSRDTVISWQESLPSFLPVRQISLGLDLQGGSYLLMRVEADEVVDEHLERFLESYRSELSGEGIETLEPQVTDGVASFRLADPSRIDEATGIGRNLSFDGAGGSPYDFTEAEDGTVTFSFSENGMLNFTRQATQQSIEVVRRRIDELGTTEPIIQRQGDDRLLVQVPGLDDPQRLKELIGRTARLEFRLATSAQPLSPAEAADYRPTAGTELLPEVDAESNPIRYWIVTRRVQVSGENLVDAQPIRQPILGGSGIIEGSFTVETANNLAILLRSGALPAPITYIEERSVGPSLGADSIAAGQLAAIIGFGLVVVYMAFNYGRFGLMADVALIANLLIILAVLTTLGATLTLPGIAGIVLTVGMAVDANVLIFERIREELRNGRTPISAIDAGYARAMSTIVDSNVTTLIAGILLFGLGAGPIRGFAVTLSIGILSSMFTAIMVTRVLVVTWLRRTNPRTLAF